MSRARVDPGLEGGLSRRALLGSLLSMVAVQSVQAAQVVLPKAASLRDALARAVDKNQPLLVMVSLDGCPFCKISRDNYLGPLQQQGVSLVQVDMRSSASLLDFDGAPSTHEHRISAWHIRVAPTVLFLGRAARELAPRLVGGSQSDFYGAYLDERLALARMRLSET